MEVIEDLNNTVNPPKLLTLIGYLIQHHPNVQFFKYTEYLLRKSIFWAIKQSQ